ncbi:hypothetical protein MKEN_01038100 [Mycena kentingensis (nom. inval.)]|nr:hypothetical protein MKEN_01038100 [Mycena kentingensis (nom. inval.)]
MTRSLEDVADQLLELFAEETQREVNLASSKFAVFLGSAQTMYERRINELLAQKQELQSQLAGLRSTLLAAGIGCTDKGLSFSTDVGWEKAIPGLDGAGHKGFVAPETVRELVARCAEKCTGDKVNAHAPTKMAQKPAFVLDEKSSLPPVLPHWNLLQPKPDNETPTSWPPISTFLGAHHCTFYLLFSVRQMLFKADPNSLKPLRKAEWDSKLYRGADPVYNLRAFDANRTAEACPTCGMPPLVQRALDELQPPRTIQNDTNADGTPIEFRPAAADFASVALQALLLANLALVHMTLELQCTDDLFLAATLPEAERAARERVRREIFIPGWNASLKPTPLDQPNALERRDWVQRFSDLLRWWPGFSESVVFDAAMDVEAYERRLIAFYLKTVAETLKIVPSQPRRRPAAEELPELYRYLV